MASPEEKAEPPQKGGKCAFQVTLPEGGRKASPKRGGKMVAPEGASWQASPKGKAKGAIPEGKAAGRPRRARQHPAGHRCGRKRRDPGTRNPDITTISH